MWATRIYPCETSCSICRNTNGVCPSCGKAYVRSGTEDSWLYEMDWQAVARRIRRQQYRPTCSCAEARSVLAPPAPRLGERTQLGTSVWGWCLVQVFCLFRAQAAAARDLAALGLRVPVSTLSQGLRRMARLFQPIDQAIAQRQAEAAVAQADETSWPVQYIEGQDNGKEVPQGGGKPLHWLWTCQTADTVRMRILPTRGSPSGEQLLGNLGGTGTDREDPEVVVVCDRWSAYKALARKSSGRIVLQFCWTNVALKAMLRGSSFCLTVNDSVRNSRNIRFCIQRVLRKAISPLSSFHGWVGPGSAASHSAIALAFVSRSISA